jgi:hypothetical protein
MDGEILQFEDGLLVDVLAVDTKNSFIGMVFVDFDSNYWTPDLLRAQKAETLEK